MDYAGLAPFSMEELVDAANSILRDRPRLKVSRRTVRYYVAQNIVPAPVGSPKYARYGIEHLVRLVGARCFQDQGMNLEQSKEQLDQWFRHNHRQALVQVQEMVQQRQAEGSENLLLDEFELEAPRVSTPPPASIPPPNWNAPSAPSVQTPSLREPYSDPMDDATRVLRIPLAPGTTLEIHEGSDLPTRLRQAHHAILKILHDFSRQ